MQEGICFLIFGVWLIVLAGLCFIMPEFEPGIHTVPGRAFDESAVGVLYIVLAKMYTGLTG